MDTIDLERLDEATKHMNKDEAKNYINGLKLKDSLLVDSSVEETPEEDAPTSDAPAAPTAAANGGRRLEYISQ